MPTKIVFTSGTHLEVDTPVLELVALLETHGSRPLVSAVDSSMQLLVTAERIEYLEVVGESCKGPARRSLDLVRFSGLPTARPPAAGGRRRGDRPAPGAEAASATLVGQLAPDS
jgi:hypothetical protein